MAAFPTTWVQRFRGLFPKTMAETVFNLLSELGAGYLKASIFLSDELTGTGSSQSTAHSLGTTPTLCFAVVTEVGNGAASGVDIAYGTHTSTNAVFTVTSGIKYRIVAFK